MCTINCQMAVRIVLKIGRYDIQVIKSNLGISCLSSVASERRPQSLFPVCHLTYIKGMHSLSHDTTSKHFNMAHQVDHIKNYQQFKEKIDEL